MVSGIFEHVTKMETNVKSESLIKRLDASVPDLASIGFEPHELAVAIDEQRRRQSVRMDERSRKIRRSD